MRLHFQRCGAAAHEPPQDRPAQEAAACPGALWFGLAGSRAALGSLLAPLAEGARN